MKTSPMLFLLAMAGCTAAADVSTLPLEKGTYIVDGAGATCEDVANAGTVYFDGNSILGPHGEPCTSKIVTVDGKRYTLESACIGLAPNDVVVPELTSRVVTVSSPTSFTTLHGKNEMAFHRCGPYQAGVPLRAVFGANAR